MNFGSHFVVMTNPARWLSRGLMLCALLAGCAESRPAAMVSGVVTLDGEPIGDIGLIFQPAEAPAKKGDVFAVTSTGTTNAQGHFEMRLSDTNKPGAVVGKHTVFFADRLAVPPESPDAGPTPPAPKSRLPAHYIDSGIEFEVPPEGTSTAKFELTSK